MSRERANTASWMRKWSAWIAGQIDERSGAICDPYYPDPLRFQYHYPSFLLGRAGVLPNHFPDRVSLKVWEYFSSISWKEQRPSLEFNAFLLSLLHHQLAKRNSSFIAELEGYLLHQLLHFA